MSRGAQGVDKESLTQTARQSHSTNQSSLTSGSAAEVSAINTKSPTLGQQAHLLAAERTAWMSGMTTSSGSGVSSSNTSSNSSLDSRGNAAGHGDSHSSHDSEFSGIMDNHVTYDLSYFLYQNILLQQSLDKKVTLFHFYPTKRRHEKIRAFSH